jgi:hypothetical protein
MARYSPRSDAWRQALADFDGDAVRQWAAGLGIETFVGTSGRVFPKDMKAAPLLRAWLHRLRAAGVRFHTRHRWTGWDADGALAFDTPGGPVTHRPRRPCWPWAARAGPRLGSDGAWVPLLAGAAWPSRRCSRPTAASTSRPPARRIGLERFPAAEVRRPAGQAGRAPAWRASRPRPRSRASSSSPTPASRAAWSTPSRRGCATRSRRRGRPPGWSTCCRSTARRRCWPRSAGRAGRAACPPT